MATPPVAPPETETEQEPTPLDQQVIVQMKERVEFLRPLHDEHNRLTAMLTAIEGVQNGSAPQRQAPSQRQPRQPQSNGDSQVSGRAKDMLDLIKENPGQTVAWYAEKMGLPQKNYAYRVRNTLVEKKLIRKEGNALVPAE